MSRKAREELFSEYDTAVHTECHSLRAQIRTLQRERDEARYHLKILAHAYATDNRPPQKSIAYADALPPPSIIGYGAATITRVVHCKRAPYDIYIGRPSIWGNPYSHKSNTSAKYRVATVDEAISAYRDWILRNPELVSRARRELRGKVLGCWCAPGPCHGDVLVELANQYG